MRGWPVSGAVGLPGGDDSFPAVVLSDPHGMDGSIGDRTGITANPIFGKLVHTGSASAKEWASISRASLGWNRTPIEPLVFVGAGLVVLLIATFTVSFRAIRAAQTDPVRSLMQE